MCVHSASEPSPVPSKTSRDSLGPRSRGVGRAVNLRIYVLCTYLCSCVLVLVLNLVPAERNSGCAFFQGVRCLLDCRSDLEDKTRAFSQCRVYLYTSIGDRLESLVYVVVKPWSGCPVRVLSKIRVSFCRFFFWCWVFSLCQSKNKNISGPADLVDCPYLSNATHVHPHDRPGLAVRYGCRVCHEKG